MTMKILTYVLIALLVVTIGAAAMFYLNSYKPIASEYEKLKASMPELDRAKAELKKYKDRESKETSWIKPAADALSSGLGDGIKAGKAEVLATDNRVVVNIAEDALFTPGSAALAKEGEQLLQKLEALLKAGDFKGKTILVGNTTEAVPARGKGKKKIPAQDARTLAAGRSLALVSHLEKNGVDQYSLAAAAYSSKQPEPGLRITARKTIVIIENPSVGQTAALKQDASKEAPSAPAAAQAKPRTIPILPAKP